MELSPRTERIVQLLLAVFAFALCVHLLARAGLEYDTWALVGQTDAALACLREGRFTGCAEAGQFPLLQVVPSAVLRTLGIRDTSLIIRCLAYLSFVAFLSSLALTYRVLSKKNGAVALAGVLILLSGYNLRYANVSFGEMLASFLVLGFTASILESKRPVWIAVFAFAAGLHKDTALPFLALLATAAWWSSPRKLSWKQLVMWAGVPLAAAFSAGCAYNFFKFGTWYNVFYLKPEFLIRDPATQWSFFFGLWFSPHGGVALFWPSFFLLLLAVGWATRKRPLSVRAPYFCSLLILATLTFGFSRWFSPFGWYAWGPRLHLPWIPAIALLLLHAYRRELSLMLAHWAKKPRAVLTTALALAVLSWPQFHVVVHPQLKDWVLQSHQGGKSIVWPGVDNYVIPRAFIPFPRPDLFVWTLLLAASLLYGIHCLRRRAL